MIIAPDFPDHWKTRMLVDLLGGDEMAPLYLIRLWSHCQVRRQDTFADLPTPGLKAICRYHGKAAEFESALVQSRWVVRNDDGSLHVRGWTETNSSLIAAWDNGRLGGRPPKAKPNGNPRVTQEKPTGNPAVTQTKPMGNPDETDRSRVEKSREDKREEIASVPKKFKRPSPEDLTAYITEAGLTNVNAEEFIDFYESKGWKVGTAPMKDWKATARRWNRNTFVNGKPKKPQLSSKEYAG